MEWHVILQAFLPPGAVLLINGKQTAAGIVDIDGDGTAEILGVYRRNGRVYLLILKSVGQSWQIAAHIEGRGSHISYLHAAPVTGDGIQLIVGWQIGIAWSELAIYEWKNGTVQEITKPQIYFSEIEVEDMPRKDGKHELALWSHETGEAYEVEVYRWGKGGLERAFDVYSYYFNKVIKYYEQKIKEMPDYTFYWYYLAEAKWKAGRSEEALKLIQFVLHLDLSSPMKEKALQLQKEMMQERTQYLYPASVQTTKGEKWGYIDEKGKFILPPQYDYTFAFQENGLASVQLENNFGLIDVYGEYVVKPKYGTISEFSEGRAAVTDDSGFHVIDEKGRVLTNKSYSYIGTYNEERAIYAHTNKEGTYLYGYLDRQGQEIIPLSYLSASEFQNGKAVVQSTSSMYALIGRNGENIQSYPYSFVGNLGNGLLAFQEKVNDPYGFINEKGHVIIAPQYTAAQPFSKGRAVVNIAEDYSSKWGLIDTSGRFIIQPIYNDIRLLGENRVAVGKAIDEKRPFIGSRYAIATTDGVLLTDFQFYDVSSYEYGVASVYDDTKTFFVGTNGKAALNLPVVQGSGALRLIGTVIQANVDERLSYRNRFGVLIWQESKTVRLDEQYMVREEKYRPNRNYLVYYPQLEGMTSHVRQERVNKRLQQLSQVKKIEDASAQQSSYSGDFSLSFFRKHLLVLELNAYEFPFGAAHGMPTKIYPHFNIENGNFYELRDLFVAGSDYVKVLSDIIKKQIETDRQYSYVFPDAYKGIQENQPFYVAEKALYVYFNPYEIAPFAAGFPTFSIPYIRIRNIIHTKGEFWRAFH